MLSVVSLPVEQPFPEPTQPAASGEEVLLGYLRYYRAQIVERITALPVEALRTSSVPSGWTPLELLKHLRFVELRWLEWGFEGGAVAAPWGDERDGRWFVDADETLDDLLAEFGGQAARTEAIVGRHDLQDVGAPGERWDGAAPPALERVLLHLLQEYARHAGHLDIVAELAGGPTGE
jgi:Protein of unknown function (DUF664)